MSATTVAPGAVRATERWAVLARWETLLVGLLLGSVVLGAVRSPFFLDGSNFGLLVSSFAEKAIMALPMTLIIIAGEIDLSVASTMGLSSVVLGLAWRDGHPLWVCIALALLVGAVCGLTNGLLITLLGLPSLVVTLGTLALFRGLAQGLLKQDAVSDYPEAFRTFGFGKVPGTGVPWSAVVFAALLALFAVVLHRSWLGRQIYALGSSPEAARYAAVRVDRIKVALFVASGAIAALAGVIYTARISSSRSDNATGFELDVIAAVLLGGVSIFGGRGTLLGVVLSLATVATLRNGLALSNVGAATQSVAVGALLIGSVLLPNAARRLAPGRVGRGGRGGRRGGPASTAEAHDPAPG